MSPLCPRSWHFLALYCLVVSTAYAQSHESGDVDHIVRALEDQGAEFKFDKNGRPLAVSLSKDAGHAAGKLRAMIGSLASLPTLEHVSLRQVRVEVASEEIGALSQLPRLRDLDLSETEAGAAVMEQLPKLRQLRELNLSDNLSMTDEIVGKYIPRLQGLERLDLSGTMVTGESYAQIGKLQKLRQLSLARRRSHEPLGTPHYDSLGPLPALESLDVRGNAHMEPLRMFRHLKGLRDLKLEPSRASATELEELFELKKDIPNLRVAAHSLYLSRIEVDEEGFVVSVTNPIPVTLLGKLNALDELPRLRRAMRVDFDVSIAELTQLKELGLRMREGEVAPLEKWNKLERLSQLESLTLQGIVVTEEHAALFEQLESLSTLDLFRAQVAPEVVERIMRKHPGLKVIAPFQNRQ
ncbi:MAG: hypothetical protein RIC55_11920 [Pirellulaceae bacterium]